jgi:hypothetical protein
MRPARTFALVVLVAASCTSAWAVNVRGRVDFQGSGGRFPMNQALVELCTESNNSCLNYRTGNDGMYYFDAPLGAQYLRINGALKWRLEVQNVPAIDIPPLVGN